VAAALSTSSSVLRHLLDAITSPRHEYGTRLQLYGVFVSFASVVLNIFLLVV